MRTTMSQIAGTILVFSSVIFGFTVKSNPYRDSLLAKLDSLEFAIQEARRNGDDLQTIVEQAESLQAVIDVQSDNISSGETSSEEDPVESPAKKTHKKPLALPSSFVDWMIILVGAVAAIAALLLLALQGVKIHHRKKMMKRVAEQPIPVSKKVIQPKPLPADRTISTPIEEPVIPAPTYTRQGMMKQHVESPIVLTPVVRDEEESLSSSSDPTFVHQMLAELLAKKAVVEQQVAAVDSNVLSGFVAKDYSDELQTYDTLYDGLEDIMSELDFEMSAAMNNPVESYSNETYEEPLPPEPVQPRALTSRETILALAEADLTPSEIARKLSMSVGEVQLILSMARRS